MLVGDTVIPRTGCIQCLETGTRYSVKSYRASSVDEVEHNGKPFIRCLCGDHFLDTETLERDFQWFPRLRLVAA